MSIRISSTGVDELLKHREQREQERAHWAGINAAAKLKAQGRESATEYGRALFIENAERLTVALGQLLEELLANPNKAGRHLSCWPLLLLVNRGPRSVALVALSVVIDSISQRKVDVTLAGAIGRAIQDEVRALRVEGQRSQAMLRLVRRRLGAQRLADPKVLKALRLDPSGWDTGQRREIGMLLLELIEASTNLIQFRQTCIGRAKKRVVEATPEALAVIKANPPRPTPVRKLAMLAPPIDWEGMTGGGHGKGDPLVRSKAGHDLSYLTPQALAPLLQVVNHIQRQQLELDPWMVSQQRMAWDANVPGLFPVTREPRPDQPRWETVNGGELRRRIETTLRQCEEVAGLPVWFAYCADFRGRLFTSNRYATHQGPDWEKAAVQFAQGEACSVEGFEWLLKAAAGHWGVRSSWADRLRWGQEHLPELVAAAEAPLDRLELWRGAKDPWQFLQVCRAIAQQIETPNGPCPVPVRFDQTCSGLGIAAALMRDRALGRLTNLWGSTRRDIYGHVAEELTQLLRLDLSNGMEGEQRLAEFWLQVGVDRSLCKGPVMTTIYGAQFMGITDQLVNQLQERRGDLHIYEWQRGYVTPATYLSRKLAVLLGAELASCIALRKWLQKTCRMVLREERKLRWTGPMGFPVELGLRFDPRRNVTTLTRGRRRWQPTTDGVGPDGLSARQTNQAITANVVHSFDAAFCHAVISICADHGAPLLTNHDCFATTASNAGWLHQALHSQLRAMYAPDWLREVAGEIQDANRDLALPEPPSVATLCPGEIGQNPECFS